MKKVIFVVIFLSMSISLNGALVSGRSSTSLYAYEDAERHAVLYQKLDLKFSSPALRNLAMNSSLFFRKDLLTDAPTEVKVRDLSVDWKSRYLSFRGGRQYIVTGIHGVHIDGVKFRIKGNSLLSGEVFGGIGTPHDSVKVGTWSKSNAVGAKFSLSPLRRMKIGVEWVREGESEEVERHVFGAIVHGTFRKFLFLGKVGYDANRNEVYTLSLNAGYDVRRNLHFYSEFHNAKSLVRKNSFFTAFENDYVRKVRVGFRTRFKIRLHGEYALVLYENEPSHRISLTVGTDNIGLRYLRNMGYAGERDAVTINGKKELGDYLSVFGSVGFSAYDLGVFYRSSSEDVMACGGFRYKILKQWSLTAKVEEIRNDRYEYDTRGILNTEVRF